MFLLSYLLLVLYHDSFDSGCSVGRLCLGGLPFDAIRSNSILRSLVSGHVDEVISTAACCSCTLSSCSSSLDMDGMYPLSRFGVNVHIRLLDSSLPVVVLRGKLEDIPASILLQFLGGAP